MESIIDNLDEAQRAFDTEVKQLLINSIDMVETDAQRSALSYAFEMICKRYISYGYLIGEGGASYDPDTKEFSGPKLWVHHGPNLL